MNRKWIYAAALLSGLWIGTILVRPKEAFSPQPAHTGLAETMGRHISSRSPESIGVAISRMISAQNPAMNHDVPINHALDILFAQRKSPLRTRAFLKSRLQMMSTDEVKQALVNGEIQSKAELEEAARRLAKEDPEGTFNELNNHRFRLGGMENVYAFSDTLLQTWGDADSSAVVDRLQKMDRGGSQQDFSLRFSNHLAKSDPSAAARRFDDLIYLRNMEGEGSMVFTDNAYAKQIVESWRQKNKSEMLEYIDHLESGPTRGALDNAINHLEPGPALSK